jgi:hypothetical protein
MKNREPGLAGGACPRGDTCLPDSCGCGSASRYCCRPGRSAGTSHLSPCTAAVPGTTARGPGYRLRRFRDDRGGVCSRGWFFCLSSRPKSRDLAGLLLHGRRAWHHRARSRISPAAIPGRQGWGALPWVAFRLSSRPKSRDLARFLLHGRPAWHHRARSRISPAAIPGRQGFGQRFRIPQLLSSRPKSRDLARFLLHGRRAWHHRARSRIPPAAIPGRHGQVAGWLRGDRVSDARGNPV